MGRYPIPPKYLTFGQILLMCIVYISIALYILVVYTIIKYRKKHSIFRSVFYSLVINQSFADLCITITLDIVFRPRKYRFFDLFDEQHDTFFTDVSYYMMVTARSIMVLGYVPFAVNRFTAFYAPGSYDKIWSKKLFAFFVCMQWMLPITVNAIVFLSTRYTVSFTIIPDGIMQIFADGGISRFDALQDVICTLSVCATCSTLYLLAFYFKNSNKISSRVTSTDMKLLMCSVVTFIPMLIEAGRGILHLLGTFSETNKSLHILATEMWFYTLDLMSAMQPWTLILTNSLLRKLIFRLAFKGKYSAAEVTTTSQIQRRKSRTTSLHVNVLT